MYDMKSAIYLAMLMLAGFTFIGCTTLEPHQKEWLSETETLVEAKDPNMRTVARTGLPEIDAIADSITMLTAFSSEAMTTFVYNTDALSCWNDYAAWATDAEATKLRKENRFAGIAYEQARMASFSTVLKRNSMDAEQDIDYLVEFDKAKDPEGKESIDGERAWTKAVVDKYYEPIGIMVAKIDSATGKKVYRTVFGGEAVFDNEETVKDFLLKKASLIEETPMTFTYIEGGIPTSTPTYPATITRTNEEGKAVEVVNPDYEAIASMSVKKTQKDGTVVTVPVGTLVELKNDAGKVVAGYRTFVDATGTYNCDLADVAQVDAIAISELTGQFATVKVEKKVDLARVIVEKFDQVAAYAQKIAEEENEEARKALEDRYDEVAEAAVEEYLDALAVEGIDWVAFLRTLTEKSLQATQHAAQFAAASQANGTKIAALAFGQSVCSEISASDSLAALKRLGSQVALNVKLLPILVSAVTERISQ